jgi:hypothetical protein
MLDTTHDFTGTEYRLCVPEAATPAELESAAEGMRREAARLSDLATHRRRLDADRASHRAHRMLDLLLDAAAARSVLPGTALFVARYAPGQGVLPGEVLGVLANRLRSTPSGSLAVTGVEAFGRVVDR